MVAVLLASCGSDSNGAVTPVETKAPAASSSPASSPSPSPSPTWSAAEGLLNQLSSPQRKGKYAPRDDCAKVPGAAEFRRKLAEAVLTNDAEGVAALASPDIRLGFAGDDGRARFLAQLKEPKGELMAELKRVLPLGCAVTDKGTLLTAPWFFAQDMGEDIDGYSATIVTGEDVPVYAAMNAKLPIKQRLSWDLVELNDGLYPEKPFQQVQIPGGPKGFVATDKLRSLLDYRLLANREKGQWKITAFLAGD